MVELPREDVRRPCSTDSCRCVGPRRSRPRAIATRPARARAAVRDRSGDHAPPRRVSGIRRRTRGRTPPPWLAPGRRSVPVVVLFNGGFFTPAIARERIVGKLARWPAVMAPEAARPRDSTPGHRGCSRRGDLCTARRGERHRVRAGSARAYYVGLGGSDTDRAVCVLPRGTEEGASLDLRSQFLVDQPACLLFALQHHDAR